MSKNTDKNFALVALSPVTGKLRVVGWYASIRGANVSRAAKEKRHGTRFVLYCAAAVEAALAEGV